MTLVAAWKLPSYEYGYNNPGIRVIADSMLSRSPGDPITEEWIKIHEITPKIRIPLSSCDEDWWESFDRWEIKALNPVGLFFAGNTLPFNFLLPRLQNTIESLGLSAEFDKVTEQYIKTSILRGNLATEYCLGSSMTGSLYSPPPKLNLQFIAELTAEDLQGFYDINTNCYITGPGYREIRYSIDIGIAGFCEDTQRFRIFAIHLLDHFNEDEPDLSKIEVAMREVEDDDLLLFGPTPLLEQINDDIESMIYTGSTPGADKVEQLSLARQSVVEKAISSGATKGVGGQIKRGQVTAERGFQLVESPWNPPHDWDFSKINW